MAAAQVLRIFHARICWRFTTSTSKVAKQWSFLDMEISTVKS